ncbi:hypothetical protein [Geminisphaera colitermitum]|uniref:hypothetical protein n=1 Tax=Geminisphaera colitermitum TaxID=1148786 RepID=UPI0012FF1033|nr:hypothetical protein [Geminisphaera colitermitum]
MAHLGRSVRGGGGGDILKTKTVSLKKLRGTAKNRQPEKEANRQAKVAGNKKRKTNHRTRRQSQCDCCYAGIRKAFLIFVTRHLAWLISDVRQS